MCSSIQPCRRFVTCHACADASPVRGRRRGPLLQSLREQGRRNSYLPTVQEGNIDDDRNF